MKNKSIEIIKDIFSFDDEEEVKEYLGKITIDRASNIYDQLKEKYDVETAINMLCEVLTSVKFPITKELADELINDDDLKEYALASEDTNKLIKMLKKSVAELEEEDLEEEDTSNIYDMEIEDMPESESEELKEDNTFKIVKSAYRDAKKYPIYPTDLKEYLVFSKYDWLKVRLEGYLSFRKKKPEFIAFREHIEKLYDNDEMEQRSRGKNKDKFIVKAMGELFRETDDPVVVAVQNDPEIAEIIEAMKMIRDDIALNNYRLVIKVACRYLNLGVPLDDLVQEGRIGLLKAINKFEPNGKKFSTMAVPWIRQAAVRAVEQSGSTIRIPANMNVRIYRIKRIIAQLESEYGIEEQNMSVDLIYEKCQEKGLPYNKDQIKDALSAKQISNSTSIDKNVGEDEDSPLIEFLTSEKNEKTEDYAERTSMIEGIKKILDNYVENEKNVANKYVQLTFGDPEKKIHIILISDKEYDALVDKKLSRDEKRKRFQEFLDRYGFTSEYTFEGKKEISISSGERKALVYAYRTGLSYDIPKENVYLTAERFLNRRNYNGVLFPESKSDTRLVLTLDDTGKLFGLTRERVRQIEEEIGEKVTPFIENTRPLVRVTCTVHLDGELKNIYKISDFKSTDPGFEMALKSNGNVEIDDDGNIVPIKPGKATLSIKTKKDKYEITIQVKPLSNSPLKRGHYKKRLILKNEKDSQ